MIGGGCESDEVTNVTLTDAEVTFQLTGRIVDHVTGLPLEGAAYHHVIPTIRASATTMESSRSTGSKPAPTTSSFPLPGTPRLGSTSI